MTTQRIEYRDLRHHAGGSGGYGGGGPPLGLHRQAHRGPGPAGGGGDPGRRSPGDRGCQSDRKALAVFCADNGVTEEGVTQTGPEVTASVAASMAWGEACVCRMAWTAGAQVFPVDIGIAHPVEEGGLLRRHVTRGTRSIAKGPAMTRDEAVAAVVTGITLAEELKGRGYRLLAAGEMGIGNTTTAAAVTAVLLGRRWRR